MNLLNLIVIVTKNNIFSLAFSTGPHLLTPAKYSKTTNTNTNGFTYKRNIHGFFFPKSTVYERLNTLLPNPLPALAFKQVRTSRKADSSKPKFSNIQDIYRRKKRLQENASSPVVSSKFIQPRVEKYKYPSYSESIVTIPTKRLINAVPPTIKVGQNIILNPEISTERPNYIATSTSTSVSMSYSTVLDSAKITTVLNSDHFLLTNRNKIKSQT